jgi:hypothetical protein
MPDDIPQKPVDLEPSATGRVQRIDSFQPHDLEPPPPAYVKEPLFNKKVMAAWAIAAFAVWFTVKMVIPVVFQSVKTAVVESVKEAEKKSGTGTITIKRNGRVIQITTDAPPATPLPPGTAAPANPAATPAPAAKVAAPAPADAKKK